MYLKAKFTDSSDPKSPVRSTESAELVKTEDVNLNLYDQFEKSWTLFSDVQTLGVREIFGTEDEGMKKREKKFFFLKILFLILFFLFKFNQMVKPLKK